MERRLLKLTIGLGVILYILGVAFLAVHYRFPYRSAALVAKERLEAAGPMRVDFSGPKPGWPLVVHLDLVSLGLAVPGGVHQLIGFDRVDIQWSPLKLLSGLAGADLTARTPGGRIECHASYQLAKPHDIALDLYEINLPGFVISDPKGRGQLAGPLKGRIMVLGQGRTVPTGGDGEIRIGPGKIDQLQIPEFPLTELEFDQIDIKFRMDAKHVFLDQVTLEGPQGGVTLNGQITNLRDPRINATGSSRMGPPDAPMFSATFRISGPLHQPQVQVTSTQGPKLK